MATDDNSAAAGGGNIRIEARAIIFEVRIVLETVAQGLEALARLPEAILIREEINVLKKLTAQAAEAVETFAEALTGSAA
jgi:hypothetical protein